MRLDRPASISPVLHDVVVGAVAGVVAAVPMSLTEVVVRESAALPMRVPCSRTVLGLEQRMGLSLSEPQHQIATAVGHVAYSALGGAVFGAMLSGSPRRSLVVDVVAGTAFSFALQAITYGGWLPAAKVLPPPTTMPRGFHVMNSAAHAVWGLALGAGCWCARRR